MKIPKWFTFTFLLLSFLGFLDATYLTAQHYLGTIPPCVITTGCEAVLTSEYSVVFGIPVALFGSVYYLVLFLLAILSLDMKREAIRFAVLLTPVGFLASLYFVYLQLFVIEEICTYCAVSAATSTTLFLLGLFIMMRLAKGKIGFRNADKPTIATGGEA